MSGKPRYLALMRRSLVMLFVLLGCTRKPPPPLIPMPATLSKAQALAHPEGYSLMIGADGKTTVEGSDAGRFYANQTRRQLEGVPGPIEINDAPRYRWRGLHFDVARHFFPEPDLEHLIDLMAMLKLNVFHLHLTDDQGWRLPVAKHPELTSLGPAYTKAELQRLVAYAAARFITVVPEIDMPGHMRALLATHPELSCRGKPLELPTAPGVYEDVLCVGNPATYALVDDVLDEVAAIFPGPYIHLGGDEVPTARWDECPKCRALNLGPKTQAVFLAKAAAKIRAVGKTPVGWDEVLDFDAPSDLVVMAWRREARPDAAHDTVLVPYDVSYLDRSQNPYDDGIVTWQKIAAYEPPAGARVLGVEAALWTEHVLTLPRAEVQLFPRLFAIADLAWSSPEQRAANPLAKRLPKGRALLDALNVSYFVDPPAGLEPRRAFIDGGTVTLTGEGELQYALHDGERVRYTQPIVVTKTTAISARAVVGRDFEAGATRVYAFALTCDDGCRLFVDGRPVVDNDGLHAPRERRGEVALAQGHHALRIEMFQRGGGFRFELR